MARPGRPVSENYQQVCYSVSQSASYSSEARLEAPEDGDDHAPIFSLSKSSMDVVMATGPPHKRDPAWTRLNLRRSSSTNTNTHSEQNSVTLEQLQLPHTWQHINSTTNSHQSPLAAQHVDVHGRPALSERWITNMHRWSGQSGSTHSRSSTPDTVVWKGGVSRPSSLNQEAPFSPMSIPPSPPTTPSPFISPLQTPTLPPKDPLTSSTSTLTSSTHQLEDLLASSPLRSPLRSPLPSPLHPHTSSPLPSNSPILLQPATTEDEGFLEINSLSFRFPSPITSSISLAEGGASSDPGCLVDDVPEELQSPGGTQLSEGGGVRSERLSYLKPNSPADGESGRGASVHHLELPWQSAQRGPKGRGWRSPLVSSLSDSLLGSCCSCNLNTREGIRKAEVFKEEGTMTSQRELVDAAVQTTSPNGSTWGLRRYNTGSHSFLGSPPGSRLNLKTSVGSNSNLVSPSSSMFPVSSEDEEDEERQEDDPTWDDDSASSHDLDRRRSCLKMKIERGAVGRRSSMKQVQWDEDGMTWDVHGASLDPEELSTAIRKHLEIQNSPRPKKRTSKKKKAPKPPLISSVVKAMTPELHPPVMIITAACTEGESEETPDGVRREVEEAGGSKKELTVEAVRRLSRAEAACAREDDEVFREEGTSDPKSPSTGSGHSRKRSVIRSLRWCGGSSKADD